MMTNSESDGWEQWRKYVLKELERLNLSLQKIDEKAELIKEKLTLMQVKIAGIGVIASILTTVIFLLLSYALGKRG